MPRPRPEWAKTTPGWVTDDSAESEPKICIYPAASDRRCLAQAGRPADRVATWKSTTPDRPQERQRGDDPDRGAMEAWMTRLPSSLSRVHPTAKMVLA